MFQIRNNNYPGALFVFCGIDGSGKSTMIEWSKQYLKSKVSEEKLLITKQPRDHVRNMEIFKKMMYTPNPNVDYRAVLLLTLSERMQHCHEEIKPALEEGKIVISDRYIFTSVANMRARGYTHENWFYELMKYIPEPDVSFLPHVEVDLAIKRIKSREEEKDRYLDTELLKKVSEEFIGMKDEAHFNVINTADDPKIAFEHVKEIIDKTLYDKNLV